jgi:GH15 family glucan-1,4-alpha-glucosidase
MGRPVVLSNGQLFVGLDENGLVHDFYYPYVGLENLTNARSTAHKIGVWVDGSFKWTDDGSWEVNVSFEADSMISTIKYHSNDLAVTLNLKDYVDHETNSLIRHIEITNERDNDREIRLFMHQVFQISRAGRADTAIYVPDENYILDYKGRYCLLIAGKFDSGESFDQYAVGNYGIEGKAGTYLDAEDGELSGNAVEHGGVDSVIRFSKTIAAGTTETLNYWIVAASSQSDSQAIHIALLKTNMDHKLEQVRRHWKTWLDSGSVEIPNYHRDDLTKSLLVIKAHCDERGSVLASGDSSIFNYGRDYYCYCWPRDAAYALWPMIRLGYFGEAKKFFEFARDTMHKDGYLMHKYQPDRAVGSTWHPLVHGKSKELAIQEDETASTIFMIGEYYDASHDKTFVENIYHTFVFPCANFLCEFIDEQTGLPHASYDLWEEKFLTSTYTVCTVIAGLESAAKLAQIAEQPADGVKWRKTAQGIKDNLNKLYSNDGYFVKGYLMQPDGSLEFDNTLDISSLYGPYMYAGLELDDPRLISTADQIEKRITNVTPSGGVLRYENDNYFLTKHQYIGNPWIVGTLWLAQYYGSINKIDRAKELLEWSLARKVNSGVLSEQFDPETGSPLSVMPLVWSHAEMVNTLLDLSKYS